MNRLRSSRSLIYLVICAIATFTIIFMATIMPNTIQVAFAADNAVDINSYVDSDRFLNDSSQTIQTFANVVKNRTDSVNNSELTQIIPRSLFAAKGEHLHIGMKSGDEIL